MGHYASEWGYERPKYDSKLRSGYDNREMLDSFWGGKAPSAGPCPRCRAVVEWNWINAENLLVHIEWHMKLEK